MGRKRINGSAPMAWAAGLCLSLGLNGAAWTGDAVPAGPPAPAIPAAPVAPADNGPLDVNACQILITYAGIPNSKSGRTREEALALATQLLTELGQMPDRFPAYVEKFSEGSKAEGGSVGPFRRGRMTPAFEQAVFNLPMGGISPVPVETPYGFHIVKRIAVPAVYAARFILISWDSAGRLGGITALRTEEDARKIVDKVYADLQANPDHFREDMMFYSDDPLKQRGGQLPEFYPGRAEPALTQAVEKLAINGIAPPFKSRYGFMIVQRQELLRNRTALTGFTSALHLVVSYAGADGTLPPGTTVTPSGALTGGTDAGASQGGNAQAIQNRNWGQARDRAAELAKMAREDPAHFSELIQKNSDALDARSGGDLGFVEMKHIPPGLYDWGLTLQNLPVGAVSDPVETGAGFDILLRKELPLRLHARQILVSWAGKMTKVVRDQPAAARQAAKYLADLKAVPPDQLEKTFAEFANKYSDDNTGKGGDLGTFAPQDYFADVTGALLKLKIGQMSDLVETPFGYAILLRLEPINPLPEEKTPLIMSGPPRVSDDPHTGRPQP
ncbi:MAG TPA: peptidylprolyl isomerase [Planctomycetota bacterium]|jgi:peptidyl-prolyl cis-trans isomerase SurA|nr:peptidylprolyl isomerase [Planctomycetota bacterium]